MLGKKRFVLTSNPPFLRRKMAAVGFNRVWGGLLIACNSYQIQSVKFKNSLILKFLIKRNPLLWNLK